MKVTKRSVHFDEMTWPRALEDDNDSVQWRLRYGIPTKEDLLFAASVMAAYTALVYKKQKDRNAICKVLQEIDP